MTIEEFTSITKALSDSQRVRALMALRDGELCVCQLIDLLKLAPSTVSKHMSILKQAGLVESRKDSRWVYYRIPEKDDHILASQVIELAVSALESDTLIMSDKTEILQIQKNSNNSICNIVNDKSIKGELYE